MAFTPSAELFYDEDFVRNNNSIDLATAPTDGNIYTDGNYAPVFAVDADELNQRVLHCVYSERGSIPHRASWGVGVYSLLGGPLTGDLQSRVASDLRSQLGNPTFFPEITSINAIIFSSDPVTQRVIIKLDYNTIYGRITS